MKEKMLLVALASSLGYVGPFGDAGAGVSCFTKTERLPIKFDPANNGADALLVGALCEMSIEFNEKFVSAANRKAIHRENRDGVDTESSMGALCKCVMAVARASVEIFKK